MLEYLGSWNYWEPHPQVRRVESKHSSSRGCFWVNRPLTDPSRHPLLVILPRPYRFHNQRLFFVHSFNIRSIHVDHHETVTSSRESPITYHWHLKSCKGSDKRIPCWRRPWSPATFVLEPGRMSFPGDVQLDDTQFGYIRVGAWIDMITLILLSLSVLHIHL